MTEPPRKPLAPGTKARRGFAAMDPAKRREISKLGGASIAAEKRSFSQNKSLAVEAGRKGGANSRGGRPKIEKQRLASKIRPQEAEQHESSSQSDDPQS